MKKPFVGIEAEGRYTGIKTLFLPGSCIPKHYEHFDDFIATVTSHAHVYLGASKDYISEWDTIVTLFLILKDDPVKFTVEVPLNKVFQVPALVFGRAHVIVTIPVDVPLHAFAGDVELKLESSDMIAVYRQPQMVSLAYLQDKQQ